MITQDGTTIVIDLGAHQRAIVAQMRADQQRLVALDQEREQCLARIHANRGKLDLIAELATETGAPVVTHGEQTQVVTDDTIHLAP